MRITFSRLALALVLLTALTFRALTPVGWMPSGQAGAPIVICTGDGTHLIAPPSDKAPPAAAAKHELCTFSGHGFAPAPEAPPAPAVAILWTPAPQTDAPATPTIISRAWRSNLARGPPALA